MIAGDSAVEKCTECERDRLIVVVLSKFLPNQVNPVSFRLCMGCIQKIVRIGADVLQRRDGMTEGEIAARSMSFRREGGIGEVY